MHARYFISDLHLSETHPAMTEGFLAYLKSLKDAAELYILGDFFEAWIGDDAITPLSRQVESGLRDLAATGCQIYLMHGNRDFLIGNDFCQRAHCTLLPAQQVIELDHEMVLLAHGDELCTDDIEYQKVRGMLRNPQWQQEFLEKSIEERIAFARQAREASQEHGQQTDYDIMDVNQQAVDQAMSEAGVHTLIHGHTHRPDTHHWTINGHHRERWVLGDWCDTHGWEIRWCKETGPVLRQFDFAQLDT